MAIQAITNKWRKFFMVENSGNDDNELDTASSNTALSGGGELQRPISAPEELGSTVAEVAAKESEESFAGSEEEFPEEFPDIDEDDEAVTVSPGDESFAIDDPMGEAYDLADGSVLSHSDLEEQARLPWRTEIASAREFFGTEILYRFDVLDPNEQSALQGKYRLELRGQNGGVWTIDVGTELKVNNNAEESDVVISMQNRDFLNIINGAINPQLAILAQKVKISGDVRKGLAFQCLIAPVSE